ncbi:MAG: nucleotidyltransferase family protein [Acidobacteriota bacterium]|nr:nucleotidyltransferase family protein [Acidobacteriota bacterium]
MTWLKAERIPFAVTGGLALHAYGYARFTADVDLMIPRAFQDRVIERMEGDGYETLYRSEGYSNHLHGDADFGRVDFVWVDDSTAEKIFSSSKQVVVQNIELPVPRPEYLVAMKLQAIRNDPSRRLRDLADIQHLMRVPGMDLEEVRNYFRRYDLLKDYDEVKP